MKKFSRQLNAPSLNDSISLPSIENSYCRAIENRVFSGASLLVADLERVLFFKAWGNSQMGGKVVDRQTRFDLASLTKPLVTGALSIWAISQGKFKLEDHIDRFFPASLVPSAKRDITIRQLLSHSSGMASYKPFFKELISIPRRERVDTLLSWILETPLVSPPGKSCNYSDLGFLLLGRILETVCQCPLDQLAEDVLAKPLGIDSLAYRRLEAPCDPTFHPNGNAVDSVPYAATELCPWRKRLLVGEVHDENAYCLGGVAGHSGLFGTAHSIFLLLTFLWKVYKGYPVASEWSREVLDTFWTRQNLVPQSTWALGFDTPSCVDSSAGHHFSSSSVGHLGFTGTSFWLDCVQNVLVVLLTNRVYPTRHNDKIRLFRPLVHDLVMKELLCHSKT